MIHTAANVKKTTNIAICQLHIMQLQKSEIWSKTAQM